MWGFDSGPVKVGTIRSNRYTLYNLNGLSTKDLSMRNQMAINDKLQFPALQLYHNIALCNIPQKG